MMQNDPVLIERMYRVHLVPMLFARQHHGLMARAPGRRGSDGMLAV